MTSIEASCHVWSRRRGAFAATDLPQLGSERERLQAVQRQSRKDRDSVLEVAQRGNEGGFLLNIRTFGLRGVLNAPVGRHRLPGPQRTAFAGGVVTDRKDKIHH